MRRIASPPAGVDCPTSIIRRWTFLAIFATTLPVPAVAVSPTTSLPPPQQLSLTTKDGVNLFTTYYPGSEGKKSAAVILLHGDRGPMGQGSGLDCAGLAGFLQAEKHAVFVPDLRGYGRSTVRSDDNNAERLDARRFRRDDIADMVNYDMEALKKAIVELHNEGQLNANLICVVAFDMGTVVALNWSRLDWNMQSLPNLKQSEDVRAFVLVSPLQSYRGYAIKDALGDKSVRKKISAMVVYGSRDPQNAASARRIYKTFERSHRPIPVNEKERREKQDLFLYELPTSLKGTRLLTVRELQLREHVREFVALRIVQHRDRYPWRSRSIQ